MSYASRASRQPACSRLGAPHANGRPPGSPPQAPLAIAHLPPQVAPLVSLAALVLARPTSCVGHVTPLPSAPLALAHLPSRAAPLVSKLALVLARPTPLVGHVAPLHELPLRSFASRHKPRRSSVCLLSSWRAPRHGSVALLPSVSSPCVRSPPVAARTSRPPVCSRLGAPHVIHRPLGSPP